MQKNVASQKWIVFAFDETDNTAKTGDAAQITANVRIDGGGANAVDDTNPTELEDGYYIFDITAAESNGDNIVITPASSTGNIQVIGVPGAVWTTEPNRNKLSIDSNGRTDVIKVAGTTQTANDNGADINAILEDTGITLENRQVTIAVDVAGLDGDAMVGTDGALLAASVNTANGAVESDLTYIHGTALTETTGQLAAAFKKLFDVATPLLVASDVMVGTDSAALASVLGAAVGASISADIAAVKSETATIVTDTNEIQGKLPTNKFMGSSDGADDDGNINAILEDTGTTLENRQVTIATDAARLTAVRAAVLTDWIEGGRLDVLLDAIKVVTDLLSPGATTMITGRVSWDNTNATMTVIYSDNVTEATADHYNGRLFVPTSGDLVGQYTDITDYVLDTGEGKFTVTALTEAPADNTTFVII